MRQIENKEIIKVTNRFNGSIGYTIRDLNNLSRVFAPGETKEITMEELRKLSWETGGRTLINDYLIIQDEDALQEILGNPEPEYYYTEEDVRDLLENQSLDALKDCLDFAPRGTVDLVKKIAVELPLNDVAKRKAILDMTGFNVTSAVEINEETREEQPVNQGFRRLDTKNEEKPVEKTSTRRVPTNNKYKVVNK